MSKPLMAIYSQVELDRYERIEREAAAFRELAEALRNLVAKLEEMSADPQFQAMAVLSHVHGAPYTGPNWKAELARSKQTLKAVEALKGG